MEFDEMESCKISGMTSSFKSYNNPDAEKRPALFFEMGSSDEEEAEEKPLEFTQVESEVFWDEIGYNPDEVREMDGGPIKL